MKVSAVIPCRNEAKHIQLCIESIYNSNHRDIEVFVVDGMSEDGTREILRNLEKKYSSLTVLDNPKKLTPYARNIGIRHSSGEFVLVIDSRNAIAPDYIDLLIEKFEVDPKVGCAGGDFVHLYETPEARYISLAMESKFGMGSSNYRTMTKDTLVDTVGIPIYRRSLLQEMGLFDENLTRNQDDEFNFRVRQRGLKVLYVHNAKGSYVVRGSLSKAYRQFSQYGYFKVFVSRKHKELTTLRQLIPALFLIFWPLIIVAGFLHPLFWWSGAIVGLSYLVLGIIFAGNRLSFLDRFKVFKVCAVLHAGYGLGYLRGILDFVLRGRKEPHRQFQQQTL